MALGIDLMVWERFIEAWGMPPHRGLDWKLLLQRPDAEDLCTIMYTSGTTGVDGKCGAGVEGGRHGGRCGFEHQGTVHSHVHQRDTVHSHVLQRDTVHSHVHQEDNRYAAEVWLRSVAKNCGGGWGGDQSPRT